MNPGYVVRHDWYQTDSHVVISVLLKKMKQEDVRVDWTERTVTFVANLPDGKQGSLQLNLPHEICTDGCTWKVLPSKIEIKLKKSSTVRWKSLNSEDSSERPKVTCTSSSKGRRDWDKLAQQLAKEEEGEKLDGDDLDTVFREIYSDASEDMRKAMNKSFMESGGTVLSTDWNEVNTKRVDIEPPVGMEWKKWDS